MKIEQAKKLADEALGKLMTALDDGNSEALKAYFATLARFHNYSATNVLMIAMQIPRATHVAGFHSWRKLDRHVQKGEKGIMILAPIVYRRKAEDDDDKQVQPVRGFKAAYVFDVSQTDGQPLPEFATVQGDPRDHSDRLGALAKQRGVTLEYSHEIAPAKGLSQGGKVVLLPHLEPAEEFAVLVHELAHEALHKGERRKHTDASIRETEAEAVAFVVCRAIGLDTNTASSDYIQLYDGHKETLAASLQAIQQTAAEILAAVRSDG